MNGEADLYQVNPSMVSGLYPDEIETFNLLLRTWGEHAQSNYTKQLYYDAHNRLYRMGLSIPEELRDIEVVSGWGAKAVDALAGRSVLKGFTSGGETLTQVDELVSESGLYELYEQAVVSELIGPAFLTVSSGLAGEPPVILGAYPAGAAAAVWDYRRKRIRAGIAIIDVTEDANGYQRPSWVNLYTDSYTLTLRRSGNARWTAERQPNPIGRPLMEPLRYRPTLSRPFGKSRISRPVRSIIDRALGVALRTEVSAEFYTWPQRYLLGVDRKTAESMAKTKLQTYIDRLMLVSTNKNGDVPQYGQLSQMTMQPHMDHLQSLAKQFAGETSIPLNSLGIVFDNPSSAEAMENGRVDLIIEAEALNRGNAKSLATIVRMALAAKKGVTLDRLTDAEKAVQPRFENHVRPSMAARADYAIKVASAVPEFAQTPYFWRDLGYDEEDVAGITRQMRRAQAMQALITAQAEPAPVQAQDGSVTDAATA